MGMAGQGGSVRLFAVGIGLAGLAAVSFGMGHRFASRELDPQGEKGRFAATAALAEPNELVRAAGLLPILSRLRPDELDAIVGAYEATFTSVGPGSVAMELLGAAWARLDAPGALRWITGWDAYWRSLVIPPLMQSWARRDPAAARDAVAGIEGPRLRNEAIAAVIRGWAESDDPDVWEGYVAGLPFGEEAVNEILVRMAAREGVGGLLQRVEALPEGTAQGFKPRAMRLAVHIAARSDPEEAGAFVERQDSPEAAGLKSIVAGRWVASDAPRAMAWVLGQPPDAGRDGALRVAFRTWFELDREAALAWASAQPDATLDPARDLYAKAVAETDPERGIEIAEGIRDPEARRKALLEIGSARRRTNED
jgi:hypothetical protein